MDLAIAKIIAGIIGKELDETDLLLDQATRLNGKKDSA